MVTLLKKRLSLLALGAACFVSCGALATNPPSLSVCLGPTPYMEEERAIRAQPDFLAKKSGWKVSFVDRREISLDPSPLASGDIILFGRECNTWESSDLEKISGKVIELAAEGRMVVVDSIRKGENRWLLKAPQFHGIEESLSRKTPLEASNAIFWNFPNALLQDLGGNPLKAGEAAIHGDGKTTPFAVATVTCGKGMLVFCPNAINAKLLENIYSSFLLAKASHKGLARLDIPELKFGANEIRLVSSETPAKPYRLTLKAPFETLSFDISSIGANIQSMSVPESGCESLSASISDENGTVLSFFPEFRSRRLLHIFPARGIFEGAALEFEAEVFEAMPQFPAEIVWDLREDPSGKQLAQGRETLMTQRCKFKIDAPPRSCNCVLNAALLRNGAKVGEAVCKTQFKKEPAGDNPSIAFREDLTLLVDGSPFFPVWGSRVSNSQLERLSLFGFNAVADMMDFRQPGNANYRPGDEILATKFIAKFNMRKFAMLNWLFNSYGKPGLNENGELFRAEVPRYSHERGIIANYLSDEPTLEDLPRLAECYRLVKELDPARPVAVCVQDLHKKERVEALSKAERFCDILLLDPYPVPYRGADETWQQIDGARQATNGKIPVMCWLQAFSYSSDRSKKDLGRFPTRTELRLQAYLAMTHGAKGLGFFTMTWLDLGRIDESRRAFWNALGSVAQEIDELKPALLSRDLVAGGKDSSTPLHWLVSRASGRTYLLVASTAKEPLDVEISLKGLSQEPVDEFFESRLLFPVKESFKDSFKPYDAHVYAICGLKELTHPAFKTSGKRE